MALPVITIVGRPNVGKSSLFNALAGQMISIVDPTAGVTRDRVSTILEIDDRYIELVDTGGYGIVDSDALEDHITTQIHTAMSKADLVIFVVDIRDGIMPLDEKIAQLLRKTKLKVVVAANKADTAKLFPQAGEFARLGFGEAVCISALNNMNKRVLMERVLKEVAHMPSETPKQEVMKFALIGKRNAGKSSFINAIVGEERVIVSEVPGTTRDAVDVRFEKDGETFVAIDTAGVRKKSQTVNNDIDFYSYTRATRSIRRADVILFMIDATEHVSQVDKKLANFIAEEYKPCILVVNKWDLAKETADTEDYSDYLTKVMPGLRYAPIAFTTAKDAKNIQSVIDLAKQLFKQASTRISTGRLNKFFEEITNAPVSVPRKKIGFPRIYYATQIETNPITIVLFVNRVELFEENYQRFILNRLREILPIAEVPIRLIIKPKRREEEKDKK
jgi:GTP-binding protein